MGLQQLFAGILTFINTILFPTLMAFAFLAFLWNITRYFIIGGANEEDRTKAKSLALWGILAFVVIAGIWGIVHIFVVMFGLGGQQPITPDYMSDKQYIPPDDWQPGANLSDDCNIIASDGSCAGAQYLRR